MILENQLWVQEVVRESGRKIARVKLEFHADDGRDGAYFYIEMPMSWTRLDDSNGLDKYLIAQTKALIDAAHNMVLKREKPGPPIWTLSDRLGRTTYEFDPEKHRSEDLVRPHVTQEHPGMRIPYRSADTVFLMERLEEGEWVLDADLILPRAVGDDPDAATVALCLDISSARLRRCAQLALSSKLLAAICVMPRIGPSDLHWDPSAASGKASLLDASSKAAA